MEYNTVNTGETEEREIVSVGTILVAILIEFFLGSYIGWKVAGLIGAIAAEFLNSLYAQIIILVVAQAIILFIVWKLSIATAFKTKTILRKDVSKTMLALVIASILMSGIITVLNIREENETMKDLEAEYTKIEKDYNKIVDTYAEIEELLGEKLDGEEENLSSLKAEMKEAQDLLQTRKKAAVLYYVLGALTFFIVLPFVKKDLEKNACEEITASEQEENPFEYADPFTTEQESSEDLS